MHAKNKSYTQYRRVFGQILATTIDASSVAVAMEMMTGYVMSSYCVCYLADSKDTRHRLMYLDR